MSDIHIIQRPGLGLTVGYIINTIEHIQIKLAIARTSPKDNYCRKTGRMIVMGRLKSTKIGRYSLMNFRDWSSLPRQVKNG